MPGHLGTHEDKSEVSVVTHTTEKSIADKIMNVNMKDNTSFKRKQRTVSSQSCDEQNLLNRIKFTKYKENIKLNAI